MTKTKAMPDLGLESKIQSGTRQQKRKAERDAKKPVMKITTKDGKNIEPPKPRKFVLTFDDTPQGLQSNIDTQGFSSLEQIAMLEIIKNNILRDHFTPK